MIIILVLAIVSGMYIQTRLRRLFALRRNTPSTRSRWYVIIIIRLKRAIREQVPVEEEDP